jgi:cutinase
MDTRFRYREPRPYSFVSKAKHIYQYPANIGADSPSRGAADIISRLQKQTTACPNQKFGIVGYSQGSMVARIALSDASKLGPEVFGKIVGGATFGDPASRGKNNTVALPGLPPNFVPPPFAGDLDSKVKVYCVPGDPV